MNKKKIFRVALVGCGGWGSVHAETYHNNPRTELVGICGRGKERSEALARKYKVPAFYDVQHMAQKTQPDMVSIVTPHYTHVEYARQVIEKGIACFVEKPLASDSKTARELVELAESRGVPFIINFNHRYSAQAQFIRRVIDEGRLGKIAFATAHFHGWHKHYPDEYPVHDVLVSMQCHMIDLLRYFLGEIVTVQTELYDFRGIGKFTTAALVFRHKNEAISSLLGSFDGDYASHEAERLEIVGENGRALVRNMAGEAEFQTKDSRITEHWRPGLFDDNLRSFRYTVNQHLELILDSLEKGGPVPTPASEGLRALEIAEGALKSHLEGRRIRV